MSRYKNLFLIVFAFIAGVVATLSTGFVFAHGGDTNLIHGCIRNNGLLAGFVRIVGATTNCANNETSLDWKQGLNDPPFSCPGCSFNSTGTLGSKLAGKNLTNAILQTTDMSGSNLSGTIFVAADLDFANFSSVNASNANLTNASLPNLNAGLANFSGANFTNANLTNAALDLTNLTNANFTGANLTNATGMDTATLTGVTWSNTTCPDGTNSDNNGNTCIGHLTP